tara:strand:- start:1044 stop:1424 length:381 start_codon:yes stop_codon:yes gene_type:complete
MIADNIIENHLRHIDVAKEHINACIKYNMSIKQVMQQIQDVYESPLPVVDTWNEVVGFLCSANIKLEALNSKILQKEKREKEIKREELRFSCEDYKPTEKYIIKSTIKPKSNYKPYEPKHDGIDAF